MVLVRVVGRRRPAVAMDECINYMISRPRWLSSIFGDSSDSSGSLWRCHESCLVSSTTNPRGMIKCQVVIHIGGAITMMPAPRYSIFSHWWSR